MPITLSPKPSTTRLTRTSLVASAISILLATTILVVWLVLPRGQVTIWMQDIHSWLLSEFEGPYTPTEDLLILSSAFSVVVSTLLEVLLLFVLRNKLKRTKTWLRYTLYTILFANAALAFTAFLYASVSTTIGEACTNVTGDAVINEYGHQRGVNARALDRVELEQSSSYGEGLLCGRRMVSRWLSLLISFFSIILLISAWLDFREQDRRESKISQLSAGPLSKKGALPRGFVENVV
ncbi:uncharacterized protein F4807DRAFT_328078 [Annulohypoxylon truncatum]|uniref:uncharacterized protein n=1 Tax=Annulohypoxylon truncatum TaxID=327061 RepID=UPI002008D643|nr:uncharacterized protein F4807DRAFT_328078 [Annulohypoxylon truncatum]KAI1204603.1 hypothetical protein F4807DRAFT_328078 [Annulohypoxylon truncatum]